jgi:hypothetical protein
LVTAFTIGHSLTLALSAFNLLRLPANWIEFFIPLTILATAIANLIQKQKQNVLWAYPMALCFGLIHGMGFSNYLKSLLGTDTSIITQLLAFNLGLECGQLIIVITILALAQLMVKQFKIVQRKWIIFLSAVVLGLALQMCTERFIALIN